MKSQEFECKIIKGHIIAEMNGAMVLIDSGSPLSFSSNGKLNLNGRVFEISTDYLGFTVDDVSSLIEVKVVALIGGDIMNYYEYCIDLASNIIGFFDSPVEKTGEVLPAHYVMGVPSIQVQYDQQASHMFLDSASKLNYLTAESLHGCPSLGTATDFYLGYGPFTTAIFEKNVTIAGRDLNATFGVLPPLLEQTLLITTGAKGIIGSAIFKQAKVCFSKRDATVTFDWYPENQLKGDRETK